MKKNLEKFLFTKFYLVSNKPPPPPPARCRFKQGIQHFDDRWYFCLSAQRPRDDSRPLVLVAPHPGQTIMHTN